MFLRKSVIKPRPRRISNTKFISCTLFKFLEMPKEKEKQNKQTKQMNKKTSAQQGSGELGQKGCDSTALVVSAWISDLRLGSFARGPNTSGKELLFSHLGLLFSPFILPDSSFPAAQLPEEITEILQQELHGTLHCVLCFHLLCLPLCCSSC